jgi:hypothetical protein
LTGAHEGVRMTALQLFGLVVAIDLVVLASIFDRRVAARHGVNRSVRPPDGPACRQRVVLYKYE